MNTSEIQEKLRNRQKYLKWFMPKMKTKYMKI
jgi:hypothetical protein